MDDAYVDGLQQESQTFVRRRSTRANSDYVTFVESESEVTEGSDFFDGGDEEDPTEEKLYNELKASLKPPPRPPAPRRHREREARPTDFSSGTDDENADYSVSLNSDSISFIASSRDKRVTSTVSYDENLLAGISDSEEMQAENEGLPTIEKIVCVFVSGEERKYLVKLARNPMCLAPYLTEEEMLKHPGGNYQLVNFKNKESTVGLVESESAEGHYVLADDPQNRNTLNPERIVARNDETGLYLVKWEGLSYEYATWENLSDIEGNSSNPLPNSAIFKELIQSFEIRKSSTSHPRSVPYRPYGTANNPLPEYKNGNQLRDYQVSALNWLRLMNIKNTNAILADEMGLGKTITSISFLNDIVNSNNVRGPFLIIAPLSTLPNWQRELNEWTDIDTVLFHGTQTVREMIAKFEFPHAQAILTNMETVLKSPQFNSIKWKVMIIDEAHKIKNPNSKLYKHLFAIEAERKILLTGTPIQNNVEEIFALLHFIEPDKFPAAYHTQVTSAEEVESIRDTLKKYMLRRKKRDVETTLAPKEEMVVSVELTKPQKYYYRLLIDSKLNALRFKTAVPTDLHNLSMQLRKVCNHPFLLKGAEDEIGYDQLVNASGKMMFLSKLIPRVLSKGHKILIFSQMVRVLDIISDYLTSISLNFVRLDGTINRDSRQASIDKFNAEDGGVSIFLLCTKAGGVGLNLAAANTVVIFDSDWNPQNDLQAQARAHRIGQKSEVKVYRLITRGTYESEMFDRASRKLGLEQAVLETQMPTANEIEMLIRRGVYAAVQDDDEAEKFATEDIDTILERRTKKLSEIVNTDDTFSKACFITDGSAIDVNDVDFWDKVMPSIATDEAFEWDARRRDLAVRWMASLGWGRWAEIASRVGVDETEVRDACHVIASILTRCGEIPEYPGKLTNKQKEVEKSDALSSKRWRSQMLVRAPELCEQMKFMSVVSRWISESKPKIRKGLETPRGIRAGREADILNSLWQRGWGSWAEVCEDVGIQQKYIKKLEPYIVNLIYHVEDMLNSGSISDEEENNQSSENEEEDVSRPETIRCTRDDIKSASDFGTGFIVDVCYAIDELDVLATRTTIKKLMKKMGVEGNISRSLAAKIVENSLCIRRVTDALNKLTPDDFTDIESDSYLPTYYEAGPHDYLLCKFVSENGLGDFQPFLVLIGALKEGEVPSRRGKFAFPLDESEVVYRINVVLDALNYPRYVPIPNPLPSLASLPITIGGFTVENMGEGELYVEEGYLYRRKFASITKYKGVLIRCRVLPDGLFEIRRKDRGTAFTGETIYDAFVKYDKLFDDDSIHLFGLKLPVVQYKYNELLGDKQIEGYTPPVWVEYSPGKSVF